MKSNNSSVGAAGVVCGIIGLLTLIFVVLRLVGLITWSWLWILSPLWISFVFTIIASLVALLVFAIKNYLDQRRPRY